MSYNTYKINDLKNFSDAIKAFSLYGNGGFWVKKIINKKGSYNVSVEGPYDINQAEKISERWKDIISYEDIDTAEVLSFGDLVCHYNDIPNGLDNENSWKPEPGMKLLCLTHGNLKAVYYPEQETKKAEFIKYSNYVSSHGVVNMCTGKIKIYYKESDKEGYKLASILKRFFINSDKYSKEERTWILNKILNNTSNKGIKPLIIPDYILSNSNDCSVINIQYFKEYMDLKISSKRKIKKLFNYLKKCIPENLIEIDDNDDKFSIKFGFDLTLVKNDNCPKKMYLEKSKDEDVFNLILSDYSESFCIGIFNIENSSGEMRIDIPENIDEWNRFIQDELGSENEINSLNYYGSILLFISRCLGIKNVSLRDSRLEKCICNPSGLGVYINPIRYLAGVESIYYNLGFRETKKSEIEEILENYKYLTVSDITTMDSGGYNNVSLEKIAILYLEKLCKYSYMCNIMSEISGNLYDEMENCCIGYKLNLEEKDLKYYKNYF